MLLRTIIKYLFCRICTYRRWRVGRSTDGFPRWRWVKPHRGTTDDLILWNIWTPWFGHCLWLEPLDMSNDRPMIMCPNLTCRKILRVPESSRGKTVRCIGCGCNVKIPVAKPPPSKQ